MNRAATVLKVKSHDLSLDCLSLPWSTVSLQIILTHFGIASDKHFSHHRHECDFFGFLPLANEMLIEPFHGGIMLNRTEDSHRERTAYADPPSMNMAGAAPHPAIDIMRRHTD